MIKGFPNTKKKGPVKDMNQAARLGTLGNGGSNTEQQTETENAVL